MYEKIYGIVPALTTPFQPDDTLDEVALAAEVRYMIDVAKVHGIGVGGSTGEGHTLTTAETRRMAQIATDEAKGRVPVISGVIVDSTSMAIERGKAVRDLGVSALLVAPPHYLWRPDDDAMLRHFEALAKGTGVPVIIYNVVPWAFLSAQLLTRIVTTVEGVIGVKQGAGDFKLLADLILMIGNRGRIMSAVDPLMYPAFMLGAHGAIAGIASAVPTLLVQLWDAVKAGDHKKALNLHEKILPIRNALADGTNYSANVKTCLELLGRRAGLPRPPMPVSSPAQRKAIQAALQGAGLL